MHVHEDVFYSISVGSRIADKLRLPHKNPACQNLCYLTSNTSSNQFMLITYIIKMKRANPVKRICPCWNVISQIFYATFAMSHSAVRLSFQMGMRFKWGSQELLRPEAFRNPIARGLAFTPTSFFCLHYFFWTLDFSFQGHYIRSFRLFCGLYQSVHLYRFFFQSFMTLWLLFWTWLLGIWLFCMLLLCLLC